MKFRGIDTRGAPRPVRRALETISEYLERSKVSATSNTAEPSTATASKPSDQLGRVKYVLSGATGTVSYLPPPSPDTLLVMRFTGTPTLVEGGNLFLHGSFTPTSTEGALLLVSDGMNLYEVSRSTGAWECPVVIQQSTVACNPIERVYGYNNAEIWSLYYDDGGVGAGAEAVTQALNLIPVSDPDTGRGLYYNGTEDNPWRQVWSDGFHARYVSLGSGNVTLSSAVYTQLNLDSLAGGQFQIYRANATVPVAIQGILAPPSGRLFDLINVGTQNIAIYDQNAGAAPADQILTGEAQQTILLAPKDTTRMWYDIVTARWRVLK